MNKELEQLKAWCEEKGSPWFTKRDVKRIVTREDHMVDFYIRLWKKFGDIAHAKGSPWYKLRAAYQFPSTPTSPRYRVDFDMIRTPRFHDVSRVTKPVDPVARGVKADSMVLDEIQDLKTYDMSIRKIFNDLMLKDILEEDECQ